MPKGEYGVYTEDELRIAFRKTDDQYHAYKFGEELADKIYNGIYEESEMDARIDKACKKNAHWKREYIQYAYDVEYEYKLIGLDVKPVLIDNK